MTLLVNSGLTMLGSLNNLRVVLTRQVNTVDDLGMKIAELGGSSVHLPLFAIESLLDADYLQEILIKLQNCSLAICISKNAAEILLPHYQATDLTWAAVGPSTANYLQQHGIKQVLYPATSPFDSAALLQLLKLNNKNLQNQYIMVFTGAQGDGWLSSALADLNATVETIPLYKRVMPAISTDQFIKVFKNPPGVDLILITCTTSLVNLILLAQMAGFEVRSTPLLVISHRIYTYALAQGFTKVHKAHGMSEQEIMTGIIEMATASY